MCSVNWGQVGELVLFTLMVGTMFAFAWMVIWGVYKIVRDMR